jgi:hypothetical protein
MKSIFKIIFIVILTLGLFGCGSPLNKSVSIPNPTRTSTETMAPTFTETLTPTFTETPTPTFTETPILFTLNQASNCRFGPNTRIWDVKTVLNKGQSVPVIGKSESIFRDLWWKVQSPQGECWVYSKLGEIDGDESRILEASAPFPVYTLTPTRFVLRTITIINNQNVPVCEVDYKLFPESDSFQKFDLVGPIQPGKSEQFSIAQGLYYFRFLDCNGNVLKTTPLVVIDYYNTVISTP